MSTDPRQKTVRARMPARSTDAARKPAGRAVARSGSAATAASVAQLRRAKGQVEGVERMIKDGRYCADIIVQIIAARASLQAVAKALLKDHLRSCHIAAIKNGGAAADAMYQELLDLVSKMAK